MPARSIHKHQNVLLGMAPGNLGYVKGHGCRVGVWQNQADQLPILRTDTAKDMRVFPHPMSGHLGTAAGWSPAADRIAQPGRPLADHLADLPVGCDVGGKRSSKGHQEGWIGYKLHRDTVDGDFPISATLTSASVHDWQAAIPLAQRTAQRVTSLSDLRDRAYDTPQIHAFSRALGPVPIIDPNPRAGEKLPFAPARAQRFKERSASERVNRLLKEHYGGRWVRVRGAAKVMCHLMFGLVALTATALFARLC